MAATSAAIAVSVSWLNDPDFFDMIPFRSSNGSPGNGSKTANRQRREFVMSTRLSLAVDHPGCGVQQARSGSPAVMGRLPFRPEDFASPAFAGFALFRTIVCARQRSGICRLRRSLSAVNLLFLSLAISNPFSAEQLPDRHATLHGLSPVRVFAYSQASLCCMRHARKARRPLRRILCVAAAVSGRQR